MKSSPLTRYSIMGILFLLVSCETVIELEMPEHEPKLVVNAVINPDSVFTVDVTASLSAFSNDEYRPVADARVSLFRAGKYLSDLRYIGNGIYKANTKPDPLQHYELEVSATGYPTASAATYVPAAPLIHSVQTAVVPPAHSWDYPTLSTSFTLEDAPGQENFYYLKAYTPDTAWDGEAYLKFVSLDSSSPIEHEFSMETRYFFSDKLFNGKALRLTLHLGNHPELNTYLQVAQVTKEYYQYVQTLKKQGSGDMDFFPNEPVTNNILNGMGLFAAYNSRTLLLTVE